MSYEKLITRWRNFLFFSLCIWVIHSYSLLSMTYFDSIIVNFSRNLILHYFSFSSVPSFVIWTAWYYWGEGLFYKARKKLYPIFFNLWISVSYFCAAFRWLQRYYYAIWHFIIRWWLEGSLIIFFSCTICSRNVQFLLKLLV